MKPKHALKIRFDLTHDLWTAFAHMVSTGSQITLASNWQEKPYQDRFIVAAVAFTAQLAIESGYDVETIRAIERDLMTRVDNTLIKAGRRL